MRGFFHSGYSLLMNLTSLPTGLVAVIGNEQTGKTTLLRQISGDLPHANTQPHAFWLDLNLPTHDDQTPHQIWASFQQQHPRWQTDWQDDLMHALQLTPHVDKQLFMLSAGSRRKVSLVALLSSGATITCIDQPYVALDQASVRVLRDFWNEMVDHPERTWVIADYEADSHLPWQQVITLTRSV
jgi:ABC-type multidrug transport system ATPase subunit